MTDPVIVIGAQPVGLSAALGLAHRGVDVVLVDVATDDPSCFQFVHDWSVLPGLHGLGVLDDARRAGSTHTDISILITDTDERIELDLGVLADDVPFAFNLHLPDTELAAILRRHLLGMTNVSIVSATLVTALEQDAYGVHVSVQTDAAIEVVDGSWLIGADGTASAVRRLLGIGFPGFTWHELSVSGLVAAKPRKSLAATNVLVGSHRNALVQRVDKDRWACSYAEPQGHAGLLTADRISCAAADFLTDRAIAVLDWRTARMHHRSAATYRCGRVLLAGAAAHVTNRITGHSSITGFHDAFRVAEAVAAVVVDAATEQVLDTYAQDRRRIFFDHVVPLSLSRKQLLSLDLRQLTVELDDYRLAASSPDRLREMLAVNHDLAGLSPLPSDR